MESLQINSSEDIRKLFDEKQRAIGDFAKAIAEREWELMEFNLFVSSAGKEHLDEVTKTVQEIRKK